MAKTEAATETRVATKYRVLKLQGEGTVTVGEGENANEVAVELFALLPSEYDGNAVKKAAAAFGGGEYIQVAGSSFQRKPVTIDTSPRIRVG